MPYFRNPIDFPAEDLLKYMDRLFSAVDSIQIFRILGGEPFLYRDLEAIITKALNSPKVKTVEIVTNGTIMPPGNLTETLKNPKLKIQISHYGKYSRHAEEIKTFCDDAGIQCVVRKPEGKT